MQTKLHSFLEAWTNTIIGYVINLGVQLVVYPFYGATFTFSQNLQIGLIFLVVSVTRSYVLRRVYNRAASNRINISNEEIELLKETLADVSHNLDVANGQFKLLQLANKILQDRIDLKDKLCKMDSCPNEKKQNKSRPDWSAA